MRKGSIPFGSLGLFPGNGLMAAGVAVLMLPLCAAAVGGLYPTRAMAQEQPSGTDAPAGAENGSGDSVEAALARRGTWLDQARAATVRKASAKPATAKRAKPVKVVNTKASWYGPGFHGRRTASGERFNQHALTLASRHLPFGTRVRVVNLKTGLSAVGRVNDRGPFCHNRGADLSRGLAKKIGMNGTAQVRLEILPKGAAE